jgi:ribosomal protein L17
MVYCSALAGASISKPWNNITNNYGRKRQTWMTLTTALFDKQRINTTLHKNKSQH